MYIIAWSMLADFNGVCMSATPGHDKLWLDLGEFDWISELLQKQYCKIKAKKFTWIFAGWIFFPYLRRSSSQDDSTTKIHLKAVIIDISRWKINTFLSLLKI